MQLGDELVREQLFFRKELIERVAWFIKLRWIAGLGGLAAVWAVAHGSPAIPLLPLNLICIGILFYNALFYLAWQGLKRARYTPVRSFTIFANIQLILDLLALFLIILYSGGMQSPVLLFLVFYVILSGILLTPLSCLVYSLSILLVLVILTWMQTTPPARTVPLYLAFAAAILITAFLVTTLKISLRTKGRELLRLSKELNIGNTRFAALYDMVKKMETALTQQDMLDAATQQAARIMGVSACSIKLLDDQGEKLVFASVYGLSDAYLKAKQGIDVARSPINRRIIEGSPHAIGKIDEKDYFQYPEDIRQEGINAMMCLPLRVETRVLGVFCVYSNVADYFNPEDVRFFSLMSDLTALCIENMKREANKIWFLHKAAHQLRSPLNTIYSMLNLLRNEHLGPVNEKQQEILGRAVKRLNILGDLIGDLLRLGLRRDDSGPPVLEPLDPKAILEGLVSPYRILAAEKKVTLIFEIAAALPRIRAQKQLLEDLFTNLISNALKYTPAGGTVRVILAPETEGGVRFEVSDTGIGIPHEDLDRLFTEFFRAENARALVEEGTGLGLIMVKEILDRLKGTIAVKSKPGAGSTFTCRLQAVRTG